MNAYVVFALAGAGTYLARASFVLLIGDRTLPEPVERGLRNIGPAVLAALSASLLTSDGVADYLTNGPEVAATIVAIVVARATRRFAVAFLAAMVTLWVLQSIL